jgi:hypothetical protein
MTPALRESRRPASVATTAGRDVRVVVGESSALKAGESRGDDVGRI